MLTHLWECIVWNQSVMQNQSQGHQLETIKSTLRVIWLLYVQCMRLDEMSSVLTPWCIHTQLLTLQEQHLAFSIQQAAAERQLENGLSNRANRGTRQRRKIKGGATTIFFLAITMFVHCLI